MKPAWDSLMKKYEDHPSVLVADIDCTSDGGKPLCTQVGVRGYPTIKYGDPEDLQDYQGGRDEASLTKHAETLKPTCSASNLDLCTAEEKSGIQELLDLSLEELSAKVAEGEKLIKDAEEFFTKEVEKLQKTYEGLQSSKEETIAKVKADGLGKHKSVLAYKKKNPTKKVEEKDEL